MYPHPIARGALAGVSRRLKLTVAALGAALFVIPHPSADAAPPPDTIRIAVVSLYASGQVQLSGVDWAIEQQGWLREQLAKRGIKLEWYPAPNAAVGPMVNEAFANHTIQFAAYSDLPAIILNGNGSSVQTKLLVPGSPNDSYLVVPKDSTAKTIEDLKGKRLAVNKGRPWEIPLLRLLDSKDLGYNDFQLYNISPDAANSAIVTGAIDGAVTPQAYALEEKGLAKIIWSTKDAPLDWKSWGGFWGATDFIEEYPDIAQLVVTAYVKAAYWVSQEENRETIIQLATRNGTAASVIRRTYEDPSISWKDRWSPLFPPALYEHYKVDVAYALDKKIIRKDVDVDRMLDPSLVRTALKELGYEGYWNNPKIGSASPQTAAASVASMTR